MAAARDFCSPQKKNCLPILQTHHGRRERSRNHNHNSRGHSRRKSSNSKTGSKIAAVNPSAAAAAKNAANMKMFDSELKFKTIPMLERRPNKTYSSEAECVCPPDEKATCQHPWASHKSHLVYTPRLMRKPPRRLRKYVKYGFAAMQINPYNPRTHEPKMTTLRNEVRVFELIAEEAKRIADKKMDKKRREKKRERERGGERRERGRVGQEEEEEAIQGESKQCGKQGG